MSINSKIFKSYDIRGIYPEEINQEAAYIIGQAYSELTWAKKICIGRDMRLGSIELYTGLVRGLTDCGVSVIDLGQVPIDAMYYLVGKENLDGGIMITASHNPKEYNGFKMVKKGVEVISGITMRQVVENLQPQQKTLKGAIEKRDIFNEYLAHIFSFVDLKKIKPFKIVVDAGNGLAGIVIPLLAKQLPVEIMPLFFKLDGRFPNHPSNPLEPDSQKFLREKILTTKADFGFIFDGDTDRVYLMDELGNFLRGDVTLILLAEYFLKKYPGSGVAYNLICSKAVPEKIKEFGGKPIRTKVGYINVKAGMLKEGGVLGGEVSGHFCFKDNYYADSGFIAFLICLEVISELNRPLSELVRDFTPYYKTPEVNIRTEKITPILESLKEFYKDGQIDELDGLTIQYPEWWFNARASNTEPMLRYIVEANTKELTETKTREIYDIINKVL